MILSAIELSKLNEFTELKTVHRGRLTHTHQETRTLTYRSPRTTYTKPPIIHTFFIRIMLFSARLNDS